MVHCTRIRVPLEEDEDKEEYHEDDNENASISDDLENLHIEPDRMSMDRLSVFENHNSIKNTIGEIANLSVLQNER